MNSRERFIAAATSKKVDRPPIWVMRQAGRALPEYRKLRKKHSFLELVRTPELAAEVTLQPVRRFGFDAAIIFSDILVIPEALGQPYLFDDKGGIRMKYLIESAKDIARLDRKNVAERLHYMDASLRLTRKELGNETALIGFGGSPWTLGQFMVEGTGSSSAEVLKHWFYSDRPLFDKLMAAITGAVIDYFELQIGAGVDALQIFDSLGGSLAESAFEDASLKWIRKIIASVDGRVPVILFPRGVTCWDRLRTSGADAIGIDWTSRLSFAAKQMPGIAVQGNLDPAILETTPKIVRRETKAMLAEMKGRKGYIVNLGHGLRQTSKLENIAAMVEAVQK